MKRFCLLLILLLTAGRLSAQHTAKARRVQAAQPLAAVSLPVVVAAEVPFVGIPDSIVRPCNVCAGQPHAGMYLMRCPRCRGNSSSSIGGFGILEQPVNYCAPAAPLCCSSLDTKGFMDGRLDTGNERSDGGYSCRVCNNSGVKLQYRAACTACNGRGRL